MSLTIFPLPEADWPTAHHILAQLVPILAERGLTVAVVSKKAAGEDFLAPTTFIQLGSDRLAGTVGSESLPPLLITLADHYDCLFVDESLAVGLKDDDRADGATAWYHLARAGDWQGSAARIFGQLQSRLMAMPIWACILIGGKSSRMGRAKHLLPTLTGESWLERTLATVQPLVTGVVISGQGEIPTGLTDYHRIADLPGLAGPLTGILAAMRWQPEVSWLLLACDLTDLSSAALNWLLAERRPGSWAIIPHQAGSDRLEPLLAWYEPRCRHLFEQLKTTGIAKISRVADSGKIHRPAIPAELATAWRNVNRPEDLAEAGEGR